MNRRFAIKYKRTVKALLLMTVYVLHLIFLQSFVAGLGGAHRDQVHSFFSDHHGGQNDNTGIATFRILEKHQVSEQNLKLAKDFPVSYSILTAIIDPSDHQPVCRFYIVSVPHLSDASYRLYLMDRVFRI
jgi:hypothetical protein